MKNFTKEELLLIWVDSFLGLEYKHKSILIENINKCDGINDFLVKGRDYIINEIGEKEYQQFLSSANPVYLDYVLKELDDREITPVTYLSEDYPEQLKGITCPPIILYTKGNIKLLKEQCFSIVGSRKSLPLSIKIAENYTKELYDADFTIVTGIAEGIDSAVIKKALDGSGKVISVLASGFDNIYPKSNTGLVDKITEKGLLITEYPPKVISRPYFFPIRNRIIAGLSKGTLVVSGAMKSGTLYTAEYAEEFNRDLFAVPYSVGIESGEGCNDLIKRGATLTDKPSDILEYYGIKKEKIKDEKNNNLSIEEQSIMDLLSKGETHIEKICEKLNKKVNELTVTLSILEINGNIYRNGNFYGVVKK